MSPHHLSAWSFPATVSVISLISSFYHLSDGFHLSDTWWWPFCPNANTWKKTGPQLAVLLVFWWYVLLLCCLTWTKHSLILLVFAFNSDEQLLPFISVKYTEPLLYAKALDYWEYKGEPAPFPFARSWWFVWDRCFVVLLLYSRWFTLKSHSCGFLDLAGLVVIWDFVKMSEIWIAFQIYWIRIFRDVF